MYLPLQFAQNLALPENNTNQLVQACRKALDSGSTDEILGFMYRNHFLDANDNVPESLRWFNDFCQKYKRQILSSLAGYTEEEINRILQSRTLRQACIADLICPYLMVNSWGWSKQVYCFDPDMELALTDTEKIVIDPSILERLPYKGFFLEFSPDGIFSSNCFGTFVKVIQTGDGYYGLIFIRLREDLTYHVGNCFLEADSDAIVINRNIDCPAQGEVAVDWEEFSMFAMNAILYLCAVNSQIEEDPITKKTYRPYDRPKNKFSEIRKWDVGVRYGNEVRPIRRKMAAGTAGTKETGGTENSASRQHRSPRAHMRRAHWHYYRIGRGRAEIVLKWIEPVFVGSGPLPAVKHHVENPLQKKN